MNKREKILVVVAVISAVLMLGCGVLFLTGATDDKTIPLLIVAAVIFVISVISFVVFRFRDKKISEAHEKANIEAIKNDSEMKREAEENGELYLTIDEKAKLRALVNKAVPDEGETCPVCGRKIVVMETRYGNSYDRHQEGGGAVLDPITGATLGYVNGETKYTHKTLDLKTYGCVHCKYKWHKAVAGCRVTDNAMDAFLDRNMGTEFDKDILDWGDLEPFMK